MPAAAFLDPELVAFLADFEVDQQTGNGVLQFPCTRDYEINP